MRIITCASYYGSGSSALTDLIAEYDNVKKLSEYEFRFLHQLDGIADLEYHLVDNHHRTNSGHALKRFERLMSFYEGNRLSKQYSQFFDDNEFHIITQNYINSLLDFTYSGWQFYDLYDKGKSKYYCYQLLNHLLRKINNPSFKILKNERAYCTHPSRERFLECTQEFTHRFFSALNKENLEYIEIDQIVPPSNIDHYIRYMKDDLYVFIVDRDPRDIYILEKYYWRDGMCPTDVDLFCKWYRYARESGTGVPENTSHIVKLQFEDFIYKYDNIVDLVERITGLNPNGHVQQYERMNPIRSVNNTQLWKKHPDEAINTIKKSLPEYLYDFDKVDVKMVKGKRTTDVSPF